jgi:cytochrome b561
MVLFHWLLAALMIATLLVGWQLDDNEALLGLHRSLGVLVLGLALLRLVNRVLRRAAIPPSLNPAGSLPHTAEKLVHLGLYVCMIAVPLLGWLKTNAGGHAVECFGVTLPTLMGHNPTLSHLLGPAHSLLASGFAVLLVAHVGGAVFHMLMHKVNILRRISP